jgi:hypothetical protein
MFQAWNKRGKRCPIWLPLGFICLLAISPLVFSEEENARYFQYLMFGHTTLRLRLKDSQRSSNPQFF